MIDRILEIVNTFSEEALSSAQAKCLELNFDTTKGIITLEESFINLSAAKLLLVDAVEKNKLSQLPITV